MESWLSTRVPCGGLASALTPTPNTLWVLNLGSRVSEGWRQAGDDSARFWFEVKIQRKLKSHEATGDTKAGPQAQLGGSLDRAQTVSVLPCPCRSPCKHLRLADTPMQELA